MKSDDGSIEVIVEVINSTKAHVALLKSIFNFDAIKALLDREDFTMIYDSMHGVNGPYAKAIFVQELGQDEACCLNATPLDDFNGAHADPNLTYANELVKLMGLDKKGSKIDVGTRKVPSFGAAADGDADRNMVSSLTFFWFCSFILLLTLCYLVSLIRSLVLNFLSPLQTLWLLLQPMLTLFLSSKPRAD